MVVNPPNFGWGFWMDIAASNGVNYFDENMTPQINTPQAVEALDMYREIIGFGPPGAESMDLSQTIQRWQSGADVMSVWWIDLAEFTVQQQGLGTWPSSRAPPSCRVGSRRTARSMHKAISLWCRTGAIPAACAAGREGCGLPLPLSHVAPRRSRTRSSPTSIAAPIRSAPRTTPTRRPSCTPRRTRSAARTMICGRPMPASSRRSSGRATTSMAVLANVEVGYPQFYWEGTPELADALGRNISRAVVGELTSQQALDEAAEEWTQIVQRLGIDNQRTQYNNFLLGARALGYRI